MKYFTDPYGIIPDQWELPLRYTVVGYIAPVGEAPMDLMACIKHSASVENEWGYSATVNYTTVLRDYYLHTPHAEFLRRRNEYVRLRGLKAMEALGYVKKSRDSERPAN
jgi:hypothetical protein